MLRMVVVNRVFFLLSEIRLVEIHVVHLVIQSLIWSHSKVLSRLRSLHHLRLDRRWKHHLLWRRLLSHGSWMESRLPQTFYLHFELLCKIKIFIDDSLLFLLFKICELLSYRVQSINCVLDLLGKVEIFISDSNILFLLELLNLKCSLRIKTPLIQIVRR
jgi:hypothetical protein